LAIAKRVAWLRAMTSPPKAFYDRIETGLTIVVLVASVVFSLWGVTVGWKLLNLPGVEFRQAQTALSSYFIQQENNFSLAYPTPVLGKPWSIPMEFPLYQWTTVIVSNVTGIPLTQSGRLISVLCYYLTLPAVFLLLGQWIASRARRVLVLSVVLSSPFYIFYARAFLMETMALMAGVWFLLSYVRSVQTGKWGWFVAANLFGAAAGLVKVTTFILYLSPAAGWMLWMLWDARPKDFASRWSQFGSLFLRGAIATLLPFVVTIAWMRFADATKALNPASQFLVSSHMVGYHFGTAATRFSHRVWAGHWQIMSEVVIWLPLLIAAGVLIVLFVGQRWWQVVICLACFLGVQLLFPELYAWHEYYYVANALFLLVAIGIGLVAIFESRLNRGVSWLLLSGVLAAQVHHYFKHYYATQSALADAGSGLTQVLNRLTEPNDVMLVAGEDWNSMTPYYAKRRALMMRGDVEQNEAILRAAFAKLEGEHVAVLVLPAPVDKDSLLLKLAVDKFGLDPRPVMKWRDRLIYVPNARWDDACDLLDKTFFYGVTLASEGGIFENRFEGKWYETKNLRRFQLIPLKYMSPTPLRFYVKYGLGLSVDGDTVRFGAHPLTQLCFAVPPGVRHFRTEVSINPDAYEKAPVGQATDGIEVRLSLLTADSPEQVIYSRYLNPRDNPTDRGVVPVQVDFEMPSNTELEFSITSGPNGQDTRDWAYLGKLKIE
jgi:hypothetical protein